MEELTSKKEFDKKDLVNEKLKELTLDDGQTALISVLQDLTKAIEGLRLATIMRR